MFAALRDNIRRLGWINGLSYSLGIALSRTTGDRIRLVKYELVVQPVSTEPLLPAHRGKNIRVYEADRNDPLLQTVPGRREGVIQERFEQGGRCLVAELNGELAGFLWYTRRDYLEDEVRCLFRLDPPEVCAWDYDVYVAEKHRLSPVFLRLWQAANAHLHHQGVRYSCSRISAFSPASRSSHVRLGAQKVGTVVFLCLGSWQISFADQTPFVRFSAGPSSRPQLWVRAGE